MKTPNKHRKTLRVQIVLRGCVVWANANKANELKQAERKLLQNDWNKNNLD